MRYSYEFKKECVELYRQGKWMVTPEGRRCPNLEQVNRMLTKAFERFPKVEGLIFHSDQGWQYQHETYRKVLTEPGKNKTDASCRVQENIHLFSLVQYYVSRILGTYH